MRPYFNSRGRRGRGTPQIYRQGRVNLDTNIIFDRRFSHDDPSTVDQSDIVEKLEMGGAPGSSASILDPFQASLNEFVKANQQRRGQSDPPNLSTSHSFKSPKEFPQDKPFFCEKCFRGYNTKFMFDQHIGSHVKCVHEGCKFEANPWFLAKHMMNVHSMGVSSKINVAADQKWIDERKRKFPNQAANTDKLMLEQAKSKRGEIVTSSAKFGKFKIEESENFKSAQKMTEIEENSKNGRITNGQEPPENSGPSDRPVKFFWGKDEDDQTLEEMPEKLKLLLDKAEKQPGEGKIRKKLSQGDMATKPTLLEMLLKDDIVHERNILLQCVHHVVSSNFFETM